MKSENRMTVYVWKMLAAVLACIVVILGVSQYGSAGVCEAGEAKDEERIEEFIKAYYEAYSENDINSLKEYIRDEEELEEEMIRLKVLHECGLIRYHYIDALIYPLSDKTHWIAVVSSELEVEELEDALPGLRTILVGKNEDGVFYVETDEDIMDDLTMEIREISFLDEVYDKSNEIACKYNDILAENQDALEWVMNVSDVQTKALAEAYEEKAGDDKEDWYLVKKGDCLWRIAESELGDGMYWGKIYELNRELIGENPDLIYVGIKLRLPGSQK